MCYIKVTICVKYMHCFWSVTRVSEEFERTKTCHAFYKISWEGNYLFIAFNFTEKKKKLLPMAWHVCL